MIPLPDESTPLGPCHVVLTLKPVSTAARPINSTVHIKSS